MLNLSGNDLDKRYLMLEENVRDTILRAHSVTSPMLFGIKTEGQLGGATELEISFNIFIETYVKRQKYINSPFNWLMNKAYSIPGEVRLTKARLPFQVEQTQQVVQSEFKKKDKELDDVLSHFSNCGVSLDDIEVFDKVEVPIDRDNYEEFEADTLYEIFDEVESIKVQIKTPSILEMLKRGDRLIDIAKALGMKVGDLMSTVKKLQDGGFLDGINVTAKGNKVLEISKVDVSQFEARYTYELRAGIEGDKVIPTTRDFCRELISLNRAYTREEIQGISNAVGWNVFQRRGGWYHNPKTNQTTPFCRHAWQFILTRKK